MPRVLEPGDYFGTTTLQYGDDGLSVVETSFATDLVIPQHEHVNPFFGFVMDGRGTRSWPARHGKDGPMSLTLFPAGVPHANCRYGAGGKALHVEFWSLWLQRPGGRTRVLDRPDDFANGAPVSFMRRLVRECREQDSATAKSGVATGGSKSAWPVVFGLAHCVPDYGRLHAAKWLLHSQLVGH